MGNGPGSKKKHWVASQGQVYVENFVNPHGDVYSGGKRSIFDLLVLKSMGKWRILRPQSN